MKTETVTINMNNLKNENKKLFSIVSKARKDINSKNYSQSYTVTYSQGYCIGFFPGG